MSTIIPSPLNDLIQNPVAKVLIYSPTYDNNQPIDLFAQFITVMNQQSKKQVQIDFVLPLIEDVKVRGFELGMDIIANSKHGHTHLFNWDSNYLFEADAFYSLLESQSDIIGLSPPARGLRSEYLNELTKGDAKAASFVLTYHNQLPDNQIEVKNGIAEVQTLNLGCTLFSRALIEKLRSDFNDTRISVFGPYKKNDELFVGERGFFEAIRSNGYKIMSNLAFPVGYNTRYLFTGSHLESIMYGNEHFGKDSGTAQSETAKSETAQSETARVGTQAESTEVPNASMQTKPQNNGKRRHKKK